MGKSNLPIPCRPGWITQQLDRNMRSIMIGAESNTVTQPTPRCSRLLKLLSRREGIIPALESSHAVAYAMKRAPEMNRTEILVLNLSGRGDKDVEQAESLL